MCFASLKYIFGNAFQKNGTHTCPYQQSWEKKKNVVDTFKFEESWEGFDWDG